MKNRDNDTISQLDSILGEGDIHFTMYGRNAVYAAGCIILEKTPKKVICLVPAYSCGDEIEALLRSGFQVVPYHINLNLEIDVVDLKDKINLNVAAILITHYFGISQQQISIITEIAHKKDIPVISDCAHFFPIENLREHNEVDFQIYSFRKIFDISHFGILKINNKKYINNKFNLIKLNKKVLNLAQYIYYGQKTGAFIAGKPITEIYQEVGMQLPTINGPRFEEYGGYKLGVHKSSLSQLEFELKNISYYKKKLNRYINVLRTLPLDNVTNRFISEIDRDQKIPSYIPILVKNTEDFNNLLKEYDITNVRLFWTFFHKSIDWENFLNEKYLKKNIFIIDYRSELNKAKFDKLMLLIENALH